MANRRESIILDPAEVAIADRAEIDLHKGQIQIGEAGPDWGDNAISAFKAEEGRFGEAIVDYRLPSRIVTIPLLLGMSGSFDAARIALQAWITRVREEGGWLKREMIGGDYGDVGKRLFADIVNATLKLSDDTFVASNGLDANALLTLEALPDFYGELLEEEAFEGTGAASETHQIKGNLPGRVDLEVLEESGKPQLAVAWHVRCRNYSAAATADWDYEAEALTPLDAAAETSLGGSSGGKVIRHDNLGTNWTPVLSTNLKAGDYLTHRGLYMVWARVFSSSATPPWLRLLWDVGDAISPSENESVQVPGAGNQSYYIAPLGQINLQELPFGDHRWQGIIQGRGESGGENISIDRLWFECADEGSGVLIGHPTAFSPISAKYLYRDDFNQSKGAATGKSADVGGTYAKATNSDTTDFEVDNATHRLKRTASSDTGTIGTSGAFKGCGLGTPAQATDLVMRLDNVVVEGTLPAAPRIGQMLSYVDNEHFVFVGLQFNTSFGYWTLKAWGPTGGVLFGTNRRVPGISPTLPTQFSLVSVVEGEKLTVYIAGPGEDFHEELQLESPLLGVKGKVFVYDENAGEAALTRWYDSVSLWTPESDAVLFGNGAARICTRGMFRKSADGVGYGPVGRPGADLPRIPVSGPEARPVEVALKGSRGDFGAIPDSGLDKIVGRLSYWPCWSDVPGL